MAQAQLIYDISEKNAELYYATRFLAPDPFLFLQVRGKRLIVASELEIDRARAQSCVDEVLPLSRYLKRAQAKHAAPDITDVMDELLREFRVKKICVPQTTGFTIVDALRDKGYHVQSGGQPFFPERIVKTAEELRCITQAQRVVFAAIRLARDTLKASRIKGNRLLLRGKALTSERLRTMISILLLEKGYAAGAVIVSSGKHACDPHDEGSGPLHAHGSIIVDIFPQSMKTRYCGDATRTFCRGRAPEALKEMYAIVRQGQQLGLDRIRAGVDGNAVHREIQNYFTECGYPTEERRGRQVGFFHGTGHSIGLEVHEEPARINMRHYTLEAGTVMSVEPGLYYPDIGGVRIEDLVQITKTGCNLIAGFPKQLEVL